MGSDCMPIGIQIAMVQDYLDNLGGTLVCGLNTNSSVPSPATAAFSAIVEPSGSWYARKTVSYQNAFLLSDGSIQIDVDTNQWDYSGSSAAETIQGWFIAMQPSSGTPTLIQQGVLNTPIVMQQQYNSVTAAPTLHFPAVPVDTSIYSPNVPQ